MNETKEQRKARQDKAYRKLIREISYKDSGQVWRNNMFWRHQGKVEIISS